MKTVRDKMLARIRKSPSGYAFSPKDFLDLGSRGSVDMALSALARDCSIRRVYRGIYDVPRFSRALNQQVSPNVEQVAQALARKHGWRLQATGAMAANLLGLSTQVPARVVYLTDGPAKTIKVGNTTVQFRKAALKDLNSDSPKSALIIQALKFIGKQHIDASVLRQIRRILSARDQRQLLRDARFGTDWIFEVCKRICSQDNP